MYLNTFVSILYLSLRMCSDAVGCIDSCLLLWYNDGID